LVADALSATGEKLAAEISLCLRYYTVTFRGRRIERALVTGGGANDTTVVQVLRERLGVETEVAAPLRGFEYTDTGCDGHEQGSHADFAVAVGLSLKGSMTEVQGRSEPAPASEPALEGRAL
jgi:Tfp pilus assembly PilM family ATPase